MYILKTQASFDSAHFLSGYKGKCANLHGHTWKIEVEISSEQLIASGEKRGMIIDFSDLKKAVRALADSFDHTLIYEQGTLRAETVDCLKTEGFSLKAVDFRPTAENFARHFFEVLIGQGLLVKRVSVYETPENCAAYEVDV